MTSSDILVQFFPAFLAGLRVTLALAAITWVAGISLGIFLGTIAHRYRHLGGGVVAMSAFLISGTPFLVLLYWAHYPLQTMFDVVIDPFYTAACLLTVLNAIGTAEILRNSLDSIPNEYVLAARACGLSAFDTLRTIQFPLILRQVLPNLLQLQVAMLQMTLFSSLISVEELFRVAQRINSAIQRPIEIYSGLALFFLAICLPLNGAALWLRARFTRDLSTH